ncbi:MAG TPA: hypothetical protein VHK69_18805 [Chitinophagaceae bacterium]|jgi:hypothetical protein|nr:hypothetical protein [Chitinophagaceae bacterium]
MEHMNTVVIVTAASSLQDSRIQRYLLQGYTLNSMYTVPFPGKTLHRFVLQKVMHQA